jgi:tetratricopeptide (TPR) repeat protein
MMIYGKHTYKTTAIVIMTALLWPLTSGLWGQTAHQNLREGNQLYKNEKYQEAESHYRKADALEPSVKSRYNLGNSLMNQQREEEAISKYEEALSKSQNAQQKADILHNLGNAHYTQQQFDKSIEAYKKSLQYRPDDKATKQNLALARMQKRVQQQQQQQQKNKDNSGDQQQSEGQNSSGDDAQNSDNDQKENPGENLEDMESGDQNPQNGEESESEENGNPSSAGDASLSKEEAERLLEIMDEEERKVQQKLRKDGSRKSKPKKDW